MAGIPEVEPSPAPPNCRPPGSKTSVYTRNTRMSRANISVRQHVPMRIRRFMARVLHSQAFKGLIVVCLAFALFGGAFWVLCHFPDDPGNVVLDVLMCFISGVFLMEIALNCIVDHRVYPVSFFFLTDILGSVSMMFEISFLLGPAGKVQSGGASVNTVLMRTARAAKVGARVGRLSKLIKCLSMVYKGRHQEMRQESTAEAKVLSQHLMLTLSTKVSLLTIVLVLFVPLFQIGQYPEQDLSMRSWSFRLEEEYRAAYDQLTSNSTLPYDNKSFSSLVNKFVGFYADNSYRPFKLDGYSDLVMAGNKSLSILGGSAVTGIQPRRLQNVYKQEVDDCLLARPDCDGTRKAVMYFDFKEQHQLESGMDSAMIIFVILVMVVASCDLSRTLDRMVVQPLERMLCTVKTMAAELLRQFGIDEEQEAAEGDENEEGGGEAQTRELAEETELLESIFRKFARLAALGTQTNVATVEELAGMDAADKGVIMDMMNMQVAPKKDTDPSLPSVTRSATFAALASNGQGSSAPAVALLPVRREVLESSDLDVLDLDGEGLKKVVLYIFFDSAQGQSTGRAWVRLDKFIRFHNVVRMGYHDMPYHCYAHACDVLHTVFRLLSLTASEQWLRGIDRYALLVAALCHDIGHRGRTNPFLVETKHELAMRYNDTSPLENMHCATLFEICSKEETDIFDRASAEEQKEARKVCIAAILHTDNAHHFEMVREISKVYEINMEICEAQARHKDELTPPYLEQVLQKNMLLWVQLFLHLSDVSNPLKPFKICKLWAWRVLDEFFWQGDEEKRLGIPVGMLNDRDKINRPGSQHGFINFLVAPLATTSVRLFAPLHTLTSQMAENLQAWRDLWVEDAKPLPEDVAKRDADVRRIRDTAKQLRDRL